MKLLINDTETTGTDPKLNTIVQIACIVEIDGEVVGEFESKVKPLPGKAITQDALDVIGYTHAEIMQFPEPWGVWKKLEAFLSQWSNGTKTDRYTMAGYNAPFDCDMLSNWYLSLTGNKWAYWKYMQFAPVDPLPFFRTARYLGLLDLPDTQLGTLCKHFGIEIQAHDALSDVKATRELIGMYLKMVTSGFGKVLQYTRDV